MDKKYIMPFVEAAEAVFMDFFNEKPKLLNPYLIKKTETVDWDISGVIGIAGQTRGVVVISFSNDMACSLTSKLIGSPVSEINDDVIDTIGEVVNIIAGNAKKGFETYRLMISLPSIVKGSSHKISWPGKDVPIIGIPFSIEAGDFILAVGLENIITNEIVKKAGV